MLKILTDDLDQSYGLAMLLKQRYEAVPAAGDAAGDAAGEADGAGRGGGRLDFRRLPGTHVTPNTPPLRDFDWTFTEQLGLLDVAAPVRQLAERVAFEQEALAAVVAGFILDEANRCTQERNPPPRVAVPGCRRAAASAARNLLCLRSSVRRYRPGTPSLHCPCGRETWNR